jgi:rhomboid protease GluP
MFIHIGFLHLALNMLAVYYLGTAIERMFGSSRFLFIYLVAGLGGSLASFATSVSISAGASGAIFGLFGAFLYFGLIHKRLFFQTVGTSILLILAINLVIGLTIDQIDMAAHLGGLIAGFLAAAVAGLPNKKHLPSQISALVVAAVLFYSVTIYGVSANESNQEYLLMQIQEHLTDQEYEEVIETATHALTVEGDMDGVILFQRSYAYIELGQHDKALSDLEESVTLENPLPEAYYNLALLYQVDGDEERAREAIEQAYRMAPGQEDIINLYEEITGSSPLE